MNNKPTVAISTDFLTAYAALPRQKQGKVTEFFNKFRNDPMHPGINFEKINEGIDKNICSVRIDDTYRGIVVREPKSNVYILLWVDHHDEAYAWAKRKKCSINKLTGSVQIFDVQEVIEEQNTIDEPALFANISDEVFEKIGLPEEQFPMIKAIKTLEGLHSLKAAIPEDAFEGLEWLGNGFTAEEVLDTLYPEIEHVEVKENDFAAALQTDASKKSFVIVEGEEELQAIMQEPLEKWRIFLHPTQRKIVDKKFNGPARVLGGAGTGKTVVAMHRAKMLASNLESNGKILFTTYTKNLAEDIKDNLRKICSAEEMKRIDIINLDAWVSNFLRRQGYEYQIVLVNDCSPDGTYEEIKKLCKEDKNIVGVNLSRNWGQAHARIASIPYIQGDIAVFMDDDGQHPIERIFELTDKIEEGFDLVSANFEKKQEKWTSRLTSKISSKIYVMMGKRPKGAVSSSYFAINQMCINNLKNYKSPFPSIFGYLYQIAGKITNVKFEQDVWTFWLQF